MTKSFIEKANEEFDEKFPSFKGVGSPFPIFKSPPNREHIKAFWNKKIREVVEGLRMKKKKETEDEKNSGEGKNSNIDYAVCRKVGYNQAVKELNQKLNSILEEGE